MGKREGSIGIARRSRRDGIWRFFLFFCTDLITTYVLNLFPFVVNKGQPESMDRR
jgi:hypothetical protein